MADPQIPARGVLLGKESANLDVLRSVAVLLVLGVHVISRFRHLDIRMGEFGVLIFFVHTTLVLMFSLERQRAELPGQPLFVPFMVRRFFAFTH